jgi:uncharacterized repeat protein (TIGR01451 family)
MRRLGDCTSVRIANTVKRSIFSSAKRSARRIPISKRLFRSSVLPVSIALSVLLVGLTVSPSIRGTFTRGGSVTAFDESIDTFQSDYTTPKDSWNLGQTAFAEATGALEDRRIVWVAPDGAIAQESEFFSGTKRDSYAIPTGSDRFAQVGKWSVQIIDASGVTTAAAEWVAHDANNANADLAIGKYGPSQTAADANINYRIEILNHGPDDAQTVTLTDTIPANTTFVTETQTQGPVFSCVTPSAGGTGTITCTLDTLHVNETAIFSITVKVNGGTANETVITNEASISSSTNDSRTADNTAKTSATVAGAATVCTLTCPGDMTVAANPNQCSAVVSYPAPTASGNCGSDPADCNPPSGSTFPIGTTAVNCSNGSGGACSFNVTVTGNDTTPPSMTCPGNITTPEDPPGSGQANVTYSTPTATDNCTQDVQVFCSPPSGSSFPVGVTPVTCTATDASNNTTSCTFTVTVVTAACTLTCPQNVTESTGSGCSKVVTYPAPTQAGSCGTVSCDPASGSVFPVGTTTVTCTATDSSGNTITTCSFTVTVTGGALTCPSNIVTNEDPPGSGSATVHYQEPASCSGAAVTCNPPSGSSFPVGTTTVTCTSANTGSCSFTVTVQTGAPCTITCPNITKGNDPGQCGAVATFPTKSGNCGSEPIFCNPPSGSFFPVGTTSVTCDNNGTPCTFTVTVNDTQPPTINCPASITRNTDPGQCSAAVTYATPTATDNCSGVGTTTCSPPSGSTFPKGTTTVTCTAQDAANNTGSCTFTVTVNDNQNPTITCPANITQSTDPGQCNAVVSYTPTVNDNCPGATATCTPASGSTFQKGTTTVSCTATDTSGNTSAACSFTVTVNDTEPPTIACPSNISQCSSIVTFTLPSASDNCPGVVVVCSPAPGSFPSGTTPVNCTATDTSGNQRTCSFTVEVTNQLTDLGAAKVWVGLKNSDDVGTKFDFLAQVFKNGSLIGSGQIDDQTGGSSGFNNAILRTIDLALSSGPKDFCPGDTLSFTLSVRVAASSGHVSGTARLWFNDSAANSRFDATIGGVTSDYFLLAGSALGTAAGPGPKNTIDVLVNRNQGGNPFKPFGTWSKTF